MASFFRCVVVFVQFVCSLLFLPQVFAEECDTSRLSSMNEGDVVSMMQKCQSAWNQMEAAKKPHVDALKKMEADIKLFQLKIKSIEADVIKKTAAIVDGEKELSGFMTLAVRRIATLYRRTVSYNPLLPFLTGANVGSVLRAFTYQHKVINEDKKAIAQTAVSIQGLQTKKIQLESQKTSLAFLKEETDKRAISVRKLVGDAEAYQSKLTSAIGALSARQQSFLAQKLSGLNLPTSLGAGPLFCTDDRKLDPRFSPAFAFFTFGIPHRVGMNQYGALGRAQKGDSAEQILSAYFQNFVFQNGKENENVVVNGTNEFGQSFGNESMNVEEYLKHLYEMPPGWDSKALQAQAIAARSYALAEMKAKGYVYPSQKDQVVKKELNAQSWIDAVGATRGKIMAQGGSPIKAWFASTSGGYTFTSADVWGGDRSWTKRLKDTNGDVTSFTDLLSKSYDKESPCFYAAQGYRNEFGKSAWLKSEEVADIANVILLVRKDSGIREHLYQIDKSNPSGTDTWDKARVRQELQSRGSTPFSSVSSVSANGVDWGNGITTSVTVVGDAGSQSFDGAEFKSFFNLRAPANIQIVGPLFNVEKK